VWILRKLGQIVLKDNILSMLLPDLVFEPSDLSAKLFHFRWQRRIGLWDFVGGDVVLKQQSLAMHHSLLCAGKRDAIQDARGLVNLRERRSTLPKKQQLASAILLLDSYHRVAALAVASFVAFPIVRLWETVKLTWMHLCNGGKLGEWAVVGRCQNPWRHVWKSVIIAFWLDNERCS
jgi:hypothetical protein